MALASQQFPLAYEGYGGAGGVSASDGSFDPQLYRNAIDPAAAAVAAGTGEGGGSGGGGGGDRFRLSHDQLLRTSGGSTGGGMGGADSLREADDGGGGTGGMLARQASNGEMPELGRSFDSISAAAAKNPSGAAASIGSGAAGPPADNWGILQYGLTLKDPVAGQGGGGVDAAAAEERRRQQQQQQQQQRAGVDGSNFMGKPTRPTEGGDQFSGGDAGGGSTGSGRLGSGAASSSSDGVVTMMGSLSLRNESAGGQRYGAGELDRGAGQEKDRVEVADDYDLPGTRAGGGGGGGSFGFLDTPPPSNYEPGRGDDQEAQQQQQQQQQLMRGQHPMAPPPSLPQRGLGGSPSLAPQRRRLPPGGSLDTGAFSAGPAGDAAADASLAVPGKLTAMSTDNMHGGGGSSGLLSNPSLAGGLVRWSFPPPGMSGHPGEGDGAGGASAMSSTANRLVGLGALDGAGVAGGDVGGGGGGGGRGNVGGGGGNVGGGERDEGRHWSSNFRPAMSADYGLSRKLDFGGSERRAGPGAAAGGGGVGVGGGMRGDAGLSGSVDSHQYALMRGQRRGLQVRVVSASWVVFWSAQGSLCFFRGRGRALGKSSGGFDLAATATAGLQRFVMVQFFGLVRRGSFVMTPRSPTPSSEFGRNILTHS